MSLNNLGENRSGKKRILIVELWGLGDAIIATSILNGLLQSGYEIYFLGKPASELLLKPAFPSVKYFNFVAPWTAFSHKYRLFTWNWRELIQLIKKLRSLKFDYLVSARPDPRNHLLMWLAGGSERIGFSTLGSGIFLTLLAKKTIKTQHRVQDWWDIQKHISKKIKCYEPKINADKYLIDKNAIIKDLEVPTILFHLGASSKLRRWPLEYIIEIINKIKNHFNVKILIIPDPDGYEIEKLGSKFNLLKNLTLDELVIQIKNCSLLICNDSGPGHIASAVGTPTVTFFGPQDPVLFKPYGTNNLVINKNNCIHRPCKDTCKFKEPICMTEMLPNEVWPKIRDFIGSLIHTNVSQ